MCRTVRLLGKCCIREYDRRDPSRWRRRTIYLQKLTLTSPTSGGRSVGIVRSRTQDTEFGSYTWQGAKVFLDYPKLAQRISYLGEICVSGEFHLHETGRCSGVRRVAPVLQSQRRVWSDWPSNRAFASPGSCGNYTSVVPTSTRRYAFDENWLSS
jgi:hypothetical protein